LEAALAPVIPPHAAEIVSSPEDLARRLRSPNKSLRVAVILAACPKKLEGLQSLGPLLENLRLILILPDAGPQTIAQAHSLRPRYLTNIDSDFQDVAAVLKKMLSLTELAID
jgi:hypothetical protein